ncbi:MAG: hypothetical protein K2G03_05935, partial [Bacilli bacterium]|nr:hypothetical protein [Bacilli bacterium]
LPSGKEQDYLSRKYEKYLNDDLREVAKNAILDNKDIKLSNEELTEWNNYIGATYGTVSDDIEDDIDVVIGYGLDTFDESETSNLNYSYCWTIKPSMTKTH